GRTPGPKLAPRRATRPAPFIPRGSMDVGVCVPVQPQPHDDRVSPRQSQPAPSPPRTGGDSDLLHGGRASSGGGSLIANPVILAAAESGLGSESCRVGSPSQEPDRGIRNQSVGSARASPARTTPRQRRPLACDVRAWENA